MKSFGIRDNTHLVMIIAIGLILVFGLIYLEFYSPSVPVSNLVSCAGYTLR